MRAVGAFREAANLSQGFASLEQATFEIGLDEADGLGERNWRIARTLLEEASRLNPKLVVPDESLEKFSRRGTPRDDRQRFGRDGFSQTGGFGTSEGSTGPHVRTISGRFRV